MNTKKSIGFYFYGFVWLFIHLVIHLLTNLILIIFSPFIKLKKKKKIPNNCYERKWKRIWRISIKNGYFLLITSNHGSLIPIIFIFILTSVHCFIFSFIYFVIVYLYLHSFIRSSTCFFSRSFWFILRSFVLSFIHLSSIFPLLPSIFLVLWK